MLSGFQVLFPGLVLQIAPFQLFHVLMQDLVPCIPVTFEKEQIVVWRGKDYKPLKDDGCFTENLRSSDDFNSDLYTGEEELAEHENRSL